MEPSTSHPFQQKNLKSTTLGLQSLGRKSRWQEALGSLMDLERPDLIACSSAITACAKGAAWQQALLLMRMLCQMQIRLDVIIYGAGISACEKAGAWQHAGSLLRELLDEQMQTNSVVYNTSISACARSGTWQAAWDLLRLCEQSVQADVISYNGMITASANSAQWRLSLAMRELLSLLHTSADTITQNTVITSLRGKWRLVGGYLISAKNLGVRRDVLTFNAALSTHGSEVWRSSRAVLHALRGDSLQVDPFGLSSAISASEATGDWQEAQHLLLRWGVVAGLQASIVCFNSAVSAFEKTSQWQFAQSLLHSVRCECVQVQVETLNAAISAFQKSARWQHAQIMLPDLQKDMQADLVTFSSVITATEESCRWQHVQLLLCELEEGRLHANLILCNAAIAVFAKASHTPLAMQWFQHLRNRRLDADAITHDALVHALSQGMEFGSVLESLQVLEADAVAQIECLLFGGVRRKRELLLSDPNTWPHGPCANCTFATGP